MFDPEYWMRFCTSFFSFPVDEQTVHVGKNPAVAKVNADDNGWRPAACNTYLQLDMAAWFGPEAAQKLQAKMKK